MASVTNPLFPVVIYTHGQSYATGSPLSGTGGNAILIDFNDMDPVRGMVSTVRELTKTNKWPIYLKMKGSPSYDEIKKQCNYFKNDPDVGPRVAGSIGKDEPNILNADGSDNTTHLEYCSPEKLKDQKDAFHEVFPGLPFVLNLLINSGMTRFYTTVQPDIAAIDCYLNGCDPCGCINGWGNLTWALGRLKTAFTDAGMKESNNQRVGLYFGTFKFNRCQAEWNAAGLPAYGDGMYDTYFQTVRDSLGDLWGWAAFYAWKNDDYFDGLFPMNNPDIRGPIQHLSQKIYDANLSTPWNVGSVATPPPPDSTVSITSFVASPASITSGSSSTLSWQVSNATGLSIDNGIGAVTGTSKVVSPTSTTTYTLTATGTGGNVSATAKVTVGATPSTATTLDAPTTIYVTSTIIVRILNQGSKVVTKLRVWFDNGSASYVTNSGTVTLSADGKSFTYASDGLICNGGMFYIEFDNDSSPANTIVYSFKQVARPSAVPSSIVNSTGYGKYLLSLVQSNNESLGGAVSSNPAVATVESSSTNTLSVANIPVAGVYSVTLTDGAQEQKVIVVAYND